MEHHKKGLSVKVIFQQRPEKVREQAMWLSTGQCLSTKFPRWEHAGCFCMSAARRPAVA